MDLLVVLKNDGPRHPLFSGDVPFFFQHVQVVNDDAGRTQATSFLYLPYAWGIMLLLKPVLEEAEDELSRIVHEFG